MPKRPCSCRAILLQSVFSTTEFETDIATHAWSDGQTAADGHEKRLGVQAHAVAAGGDDRRRADFALHAGACAAQTRHRFRPRHLAHADDGVALHGWHRLLAARHGAVVGPLRATPGAAFGSRPDGRGERSLHLRARPAATDYRAIFAGA